MDQTFKTETKGKSLPYLLFLPKDLRMLGALSLGSNVIALILAVVFYFSLQAQIPLFYSLPSDQQLTQKEFIFILPAISTLLNFLHFSIIIANKQLHEHLLKMFVQLTFLLQFLLLAILLRIIIIVS